MDYDERTAAVLKAQHNLSEAQAALVKAIVHLGKVPVIYYHGNAQRDVQEIARSLNVPLERVNHTAEDMGLGR